MVSNVEPLAIVNRKIVYVFCLPDRNQPNLEGKGWRQINKYAKFVDISRETYFHRSFVVLKEDYYA
jgi:hypothetical protein